MNEGDGQLNDTLFIEVEGRAEPTLDITLSVNNYDGMCAYIYGVLAYQFWSIRNIHVL